VAKKKSASPKKVTPANKRSSTVVQPKELGPRKTSAVPATAPAAKKETLKQAKANAKPTGRTGKSLSSQMLEPEKQVVPKPKGPDHFPEDTLKGNRNTRVPIAAIGCSAGGFEALSVFFRNIQAPTGIAFLCLQHIATGQEEQLARLIAKISSMQVAKASDGMLIEPDTIYVVPGHQLVGVFKGRTVFLPDNRSRINGRLPIDTLFRSLAEDQQSHAIGIVLSGTGTDGTLGLAAIKEQGGITFVQDNSAKYSGMPQSALAAGHTDYVLPPEGIAEELLRIASTPYVRSISESSGYQIFKNEEDLIKIFAMLRTATGVDFSTYKETTIKRRIFRRMMLCRIDKLNNYVAYLSKNPTELQILHDDFLINVTSFFRDPDSFSALQEKVFPEIVRNRKETDSPIRIWVPGCSTGEEAYSIAIALLEYLEDNINRVNIQVFATDISEPAINKARKGIYVENIVQDVSADRLRKFFKKVEGGYQIGKQVRDICVFAKQNMTKDPPFSRLDLISCRNVLIYLGPGLQKNLIRTFHQALQPTGFLMLGTSETIGLSADLFHLVDKKNKIYAKKSTLTKAASIPSLYPPLDDIEIYKGVQIPQSEVRTTTDLQKEADRIILAKHAPPGVIVDEEMEIVHFRGQTGPYLEPAPGAASLNLLRMVREGLKFELRAAITRARKHGITVRKEGLQVKYDGKLRDIAIEAVPIKSASPKQQFVLVLFDESQATKVTGVETRKKQKTKINTEGERQIKMLQQELTDTKEYLQRNIEEQDAYTEELKSANEEIQSSNEELQSTNEELETAKEELQSINEELTTLNDELQIRNAELSQVNNDLGNLLANVNFTVVMVGLDLRIRRFNPMAEKVLNIIPTDVGRPISDINPNVKMEGLEDMMTEVIDSLKIIEREVQDKNGHWYSLSIRPYKTLENKIDGAVLIMVDIDALKGSLESTERSREVLEVVLAGIKEAVVILKPSLAIEQVNGSFSKMFEVNRDAVEGKKFMEISNELWNIPSITALLEKALQNGSGIVNYRLTQAFPRLGRKSLLLNGRRVSHEDQRLLLIIEELQE